MNRRYDIDWLRVFALGLLIIYHISIVFQPWAYFIYFPQSEKPIESIWLVMGLINIWRIPLLFVISGMGVYLAMRRRNWKELLKDRIIRILLPLIFGSFIIVPIHVYIYQTFILIRGTARAIVDICFEIWPARQPAASTGPGSSHKTPIKWNT